MTVKEFRRAVRQAKVVFGWVAMWDGDGEYLQVTKSSVLEATKGCDPKGEVIADWRENAPGELYIN